MRLIYEKFPVQFSKFRMSLTGEEKPYNNDMIVTASHGNGNLDSVYHSS